MSGKSRVHLLPIWLALFNLAVIVVVIAAFAFYFGPRLTQSIQITEGAILRSAAEGVHPLRDFFYQPATPDIDSGYATVRFGYFVHVQDEGETPDGLAARYVCALFNIGLPVNSRIILSAYHSDGALMMTADFPMPEATALDCIDYGGFSAYGNPNWRTR